MRTSIWLAVGVCGAGALAAGCDWRDFDNIQADTPVLVVSPPSGYSAPSDFGRVILPLTPPTDGSAAARYLGSAINQTGLALVQIDGKGQASSQNVTGSALDNLGGEAITAMAQAIGGGDVLLGSPTGGSLLTLDLTSLVVTPFVLSTEPQFGMGVAGGSLHGLGTHDWAVVSGSALHIFPNGSTTDLSIADSAACPLTVSTSLPSAERINRAVVVGALMSGGSQVAVGTPVMTGAGSVSLFALDATASTVTCALTLSAPMSADSRFGQALAIGDFDGDGNADLLVGAPPGRAYLYRGPLVAGAAPAATISDATTGGDFGAAMAALNLDGKGGDEALIADPDATVGGQAQAGSVAIFTGATLGTAMMTVLSDHAPSSGEVYGSAVAALPFCATSPCPAKLPLLPLVGAASDVFTYFALSGQTDPRVK
jgi:FG-GAP repeat